MNKAKLNIDLEKMESKQLRAHIRQLGVFVADLEQNVRINKELLQNVLTSTDLNEYSKQIIEKMQGEVDRLTKALHNSFKEKSALLELLEETQKNRDQIKELMLDKEK